MRGTLLQLIKYGQFVLYCMATVNVLGLQSIAKVIFSLRENSLIFARKLIINACFDL